MKIPTIIRNLGSIETNAEVGFSMVPDQVRERSIAQGFELNLLVVGRRGAGTSTLVNSIFAAPLVEKSRPNTLTVTKNEILENEICLGTSIITYHESNISPLLEHIESVNREYFENEQGLYKTFKDNRIHVCLYIVPSDAMTAGELKNMIELSKKCNLIPVMTKADMYTPEELGERKKEIRKLLEDNGVGFFSPHLNEADNDLNSEIADIIDNLPFAVIASETMYEHEGDVIRGRRYLWGFVDIDMEECNDFRRLQRLLIYTNLDELIIKTNHSFYNSYRKKAFEVESSCEGIRKTRHSKLRAEMLKILNEKHEAKIEELKGEEAELDRFYGNRIDSMSGVVDELGSGVSELLSTQ
jgi:septin 7